MQSGLGFAISRWNFVIGKSPGKWNFPIGNLGKSGKFYLLLRNCFILPNEKLFFLTQTCMGTKYCYNGSQCLDKSQCRSNLQCSNILTKLLSKLVRPCLKQVKKAISRFPDRDLKFPELGFFSSGPEKSGIGKPELAIPSGHQLAELICFGLTTSLRARRISSRER